MDPGEWDYGRLGAYPAGRIQLWALFARDTPAYAMGCYGVILDWTLYVR